jgi:hypothetical protein
MADYNRTLRAMRKNLENKEKKNKVNLIPLNSTILFTKLVENQNRELLELIAKDKFINKEEREDFIDKYLKIGYQVPEVV